MPILISNPPIAAGKNTTANALVERYVSDERTVVVADVDEVAVMSARLGVGAEGLWFAAHEAHGALVAQWMPSDVDAVTSVGPIYDAVESAALFGDFPTGPGPSSADRRTAVGHLGQGGGPTQRRGTPADWSFTNPPTPATATSCLRFLPTCPPTRVPCPRATSQTRSTPRLVSPVDGPCVRPGLRS